MADISILDPAVHTAPKAYTVKGAQEIVLKSVSGSFDGTSAAGSWVPAVQVVDPSGFVVGTYPSTTLAVGASADVAWFPGVGGEESTPQAGIWFYATPVAPASAPPNAIAGQPFLGSWVNTTLLDGSYSPLRYRLNPATGDAEFAGAIGGGTFGTPCMALPTSFVPPYDVYKVVPSTDAKTQVTCIVSTAGFVVPQGLVSRNSNVVYLTTGNLTTASTTFVNATGLAITQTFLGGTRAQIAFTGQARNDTATASTFLDVTIDGTRQGQTGGLVAISQNTANGNNNFSYSYLSAVLASGSHTFQLQWRVSAGNGLIGAVAAGTPAVFSVIEV